MNICLMNELSCSRKWFRQSCLSASEVTPLTTTPEDSMYADLLALLTKPESLQVITSRYCPHAIIYCALIFKS